MDFVQKIGTALADAIRFITGEHSFTWWGAYLCVFCIMILIFVFALLHHKRKRNFLMDIEEREEQCYSQMYKKLYSQLYKRLDNELYHEIYNEIYQEVTKKNDGRLR